MKKFFVLFAALLLHVYVFAQYVMNLSDSPGVEIKSYALLPDRGYGFQKVLTDSTLPFIENDSLRPAQFSQYWLKVVVYNPVHKVVPCKVQVTPALNNTLFYYDANYGNWQTEQAGLMGEGQNSHIGGNGMTCMLQPATVNVLYVNMDIHHVAHAGYSLKPTIRLEKATILSRHEQIVWITWIASLAVLFLFFLNNVYIWFSFKDKTVLYYLIGQLGGMIYITAYKKIFPLLFYNPVFTTGLFSNGEIIVYGLNDVLLHVSILVITYSLVQFSRAYLNTRQWFPRLDAFLRNGLKCYLPLSAIFIIINSFFFMAEPYAWMVDNIFTPLLFAAVIYSAVLGYKRRLPAAPVFLLANLISFAFVMATALYHLLTSLNHEGYFAGVSSLPDLAIITQTFGFSVALVARTRTIQRSLAAKEQEARQLEADLREIGLRHMEIEQENQKISMEITQEKTRNEMLQEKLAANQRELASSTLYMVQKNELLVKLKAQIKELNKLNPDNKDPGLHTIESTLQKSMYLDADWAKFKLHFEQVHPDFFTELQAKHPTLTKNEIRLCAYFHINLSTKEIAALLNIDPASVRRAKTRLYKKMGVNNSDKSPDDDE